MRRFLAAFGLIFALSAMLWARPIAGIAVLVDNQPITDYEIDELMAAGASRADAINALIQARLEDSQIIQLGIDASAAEIDAQISQLAGAKNMSVDAFINSLTAAGASSAEIREDAAKIIKKQKLLDRIASGGSDNITQENAMRFYEDNIAAFMTAGSFRVSHYSAKNREALQNAIKNPIYVAPGVQKEDITLQTAQIHPQLAVLLSQTKDGGFTPIFGGEEGFEAFYVHSRAGQAPLPFEAVQESVVKAMLGGERDIAIANYFNKLRVKADIKYINR